MPSSSASWIRRARTSTIFALPWTVSVTIPACEPVSEIASWPRSWIAIARERARDPLADRDEHVELARVRLRRDLVREVEQLVGRVAHRGEHADDAVARLARGDEPRATRLQLLRVADRGAAELHHDGARAAGGVGVRVDGRNGLVLGRGHASSWRDSVDERLTGDPKKAQKTLNRQTRGLTGSARQTYTTLARAVQGAARRIRKMRKFRSRGGRRARGRA